MFGKGRLTLGNARSDDGRGNQIERVGAPWLLHGRTKAGALDLEGRYMEDDELGKQCLLSNRLRIDLV
jgi:hypothetical protein